MHALHTHGLARRPATLRLPQPVLKAPPHIVSPEKFGDRFEAEIARHNRYMEPLGLVRIGPRVRHEESSALRDVLWTEVRQTDSACLLPDGSHVLLALCASERHLKVIARRLLDAAAEIDLESGDEPIDLVAAVCAVRDKRVEAALTWLELSRTFEDCRTGDGTIVAVP